MRNLIKMRNPIAATILGGALIISAGIIANAGTGTTHTATPMMPTSTAAPYNPHACPEGQVWVNGIGPSQWGAGCDYPTVKVAP
jgi:hypothetical protein